MHEIESVEPEDFIGRRVVAAVATDSYQGQDRLVVDIRAKGSKAGYFPNEVVTKGRQRTMDDLDSDVPF